MANARLVKTGQNPNALLYWKVDDKVRQIVKKTVFRHFLDLDFEIRIIVNILTDFSSTFDYERFCFNFDNASLVFNLEDFFYITGLPIDGNPVTGADKFTADMYARMLGKSPSLEYLKGQRVKVSWLKDHFERVPEDVSADSVDIWFYVRAYILCILSRCLFSDLSGALVCPRFLPLLSDVDTINGYSWGAAVLSYLMCSLKKLAKKEESKSIKGLGTSLFLFVLIRFPRVAWQVLNRKEEMPEEWSILKEPNACTFPLFHGLSKLLTKSGRNSFISKKVDYRKFFKRNEVDWQPYNNLNADIVPSECRAQLSLRFSRTCLIFFEHVAWHRPEGGLMQLEVDPDLVDQASLPDLPSLENLKSRTGVASTTDWAKHEGYKPFIDSWQNRWVTRINLAAGLHGENFAEEITANRQTSTQSAISPSIEAADPPPLDTSRRSSEAFDQSFPSPMASDTSRRRITASNWSILSPIVPVAIQDTYRLVIRRARRSTPLSRSVQKSQLIKSLKEVKERQEKMELQIQNRGTKENEQDQQNQQKDLHTPARKRRRLGGLSVSNIPPSRFREATHQESTRAAPQISIEDNIAIGENTTLQMQKLGKTRKACVNIEEGHKMVVDNSRKLLILDLNGILVDIVQAGSVPKYYKAHGNVSGKEVFMRPYHFDFLAFCLTKFDIAIWSSRLMKNVEKVVKMFPLLQDKLVFCWGQEQCKMISREGNPGKPIFLKQLEEVWKIYKKYNATNTLLVDDSPCKAICNPANTGIFPTSYKCTATCDTSLGLGGDLRTYLEGLAEADNVQNYVKMNPFGQPAIT